MIPGEGAVKELLPEEREWGEKKDSGQEVGPGVESRITHKEKARLHALGPLGKEGDVLISCFALPSKAFTMWACPAGGAGTLMSQSPIPIHVVPHLQEPPAEPEEPGQQLR